MLGMEGMGQMKGGFKALMKMLDAIAQLQAANAPNTAAAENYKEIRQELKDDGWL